MKTFIIKGVSKLKKVNGKKGIRDSRNTQIFRSFAIKESKKWAVLDWSLDFVFLFCFVMGEVTVCLEAETGAQMRQAGQGSAGVLTLSGERADGMWVEGLGMMVLSSSMVNGRMAERRGTGADTVGVLVGEDAVVF